MELTDLTSSTDGPVVVVAEEIFMIERNVKDKQLYHDLPHPLWVLIWWW